MFTAAHPPSDSAWTDNSQKKNHKEDFYIYFSYLCKMSPSLCHECPGKQKLIFLLSIQDKWMPVIVTQTVCGQKMFLHQHNY